MQAAAAFQWFNPFVWQYREASRETTDPEVQAKIKQDLEMLAKKTQELKARLAELRR